jgi:hypothetical protein
MYDCIEFLEMIKTYEKDVLDVLKNFRNPWGLTFKYPVFSSFKKYPAFLTALSQMTCAVVLVMAKR